MARIRSIHPDACKSDKLDAASPEAERCYWRLQPQCDDDGRCEDDPRALRSEMWKVREYLPSEQVDAWLQELHDVGLIVRYAVDGRRYIQVTKWHTYQNPRRPMSSKIPPPPDLTGPVSTSTDDDGHDATETDLCNPEIGDRRQEAQAPFASEFLALWEIYPRKVARKDALKAYQARRRAGVDPDELARSLPNFVLAMELEQRPVDKILHGATFFGPSERWKDYLEPPDPLAYIKPTNGKAHPQPMGVPVPRNDRCLVCGRRLELCEGHDVEKREVTPLFKAKTR